MQICVSQYLQSIKLNRQFNVIKAPIVQKASFLSKFQVLRENHYFNSVFTEVSTLTVATDFVAAKTEK